MAVFLALLALFSVLAILVFAVLLIIATIRKKRKRTYAMGIGISFIVFIASIAAFPTSQNAGQVMDAQSQREEMVSSTPESQPEPEDSEDEVIDSNDLLAEISSRSNNPSSSIAESAPLQPSESVISISSSASVSSSPESSVSVSSSAPPPSLSSVASSAPTASSVSSISSTVELVPSEPTPAPTAQQVSSQAHVVSEGQTQQAFEGATKIVYWGDTGTKIHTSSNCRTLKNNAHSGTVEEAIAAGRTEGYCKVCS